jgi:hypothetical protein
MLALIPAMLAGGAKGIFENPAYLIGIPLLALGIIGLLAVLSPLGRGGPEQEEKADNPGPGKKTSAAKRR